MRLQPGFQRLHFSFFSCWYPCVHRESNKIALIEEKWFRQFDPRMLLFELFSGQIQVNVFYKIQRDISIRSLLYNTFLKLLIEMYYKKTIKNFNKTREFDLT